MHYQWLRTNITTYLLMAVGWMLGSCPVPSVCQTIQTARNAVIWGTQQDLQQILTDPAWESWTDTYGNHLVHIAALHDTAKLSCMLSHGANPNQTNQDGQTPLHGLGHCSKENHAIKKTIALLLHADADPEICSVFGNTPLDLAIEHNHMAVIIALLSRGALVRPEKLFFTVNALPIAEAELPLIERHCARTAFFEQYPLLPRELEQLIAECEGGSTAQIAFGQLQIPYIRLLRNKAVNRLGSTRALYQAAARGNVEDVHTALRSGAFINNRVIYCNDGIQRAETALTIAARNNHTAALATLLRSGAHTAQHGTRALHHAIYHNNARACQLLLNAGSPVDQESSSHLRSRLSTGWTPLMHAVAEQNTNLAIVRVLLEAGAKPNAYDTRTNRSVLYHALEGWNKPHKAALVRLLLDYGANPNTSVVGLFSPLQRAIHFGPAEVVQLLHAAGARITPDILIHSRDPDITDFLIAQEADLNYPDIAASTAYANESSRCDPADHQTGWV